MNVNVKKSTSADAATADAQIYLIAGTDEFEVSRHARQLVDTLCPKEDQALSLETIDGACDTIDEAIAAVNSCFDALTTVGFFGSSKVVWLRDASFFNEGRPGKFTDVKEAVAKLTDEIKAGLLPDVTLIVSGAAVDKRTAFYKAVNKVGHVDFYNLPDKDYKWDEHAADVLRNMLSEQGLRANVNVIRLIVERAGNQSRQLSMEVEKLALFVGDRKEVTAADVLEIVSPARERGFGELTDAYGRHDLPGCIRIVRQLIQQKESAVGLIISLQNRTRVLLVYRRSLARKWARLAGSADWPKIEWSNSPEADAYLSSVTKDPRKANPYWGGILAKQATNFAGGELQRALKIFVEEHGRMTSGAAPDYVLLEWALIKALGK